MAEPLNILLIDNNQPYRRALIKLFGTFSFDTIFQKASTAEEAVAILTRSSVDLVLLDIQPCEMDGIETLLKIRSCGFQTKILMIMQFENIGLSNFLVDSGANGFILKSSDAQELEKAIITAMEIN